MGNKISVNRIDSRLLNVSLVLYVVKSASKSLKKPIFAYLTRSDRNGSKNNAKYMA